MPLTDKGSKIMSSMQDQYGPEKGKSVFYASKNKGTISGVDRSGGGKKSSRGGSPFGGKKFSKGPGATARRSR